MGEVARRSTKYNELKIEMVTKTIGKLTFEQSRQSGCRGFIVFFTVFVAFDHILEKVLSLRFINNRSCASET